jgi:hypothetical protein
MIPRARFRLTIRAYLRLIDQVNLDILTMSGRTQGVRPPRSLAGDYPYTNVCSC